MPLKEVLAEITDAYSKGESFELDLSNGSAKDIVEVSKHIKSLTGKEVFKPLSEAYKAKEPISLEFPSKEPIIGAGKATGIKQGLTTTQRIGEKVTGLFPAAGMIAGGVAVSPLIAAQAAAAPVTSGASIATGLATGAFGAGLGAMAGESARQLANRVLGLPSLSPSEAAIGIGKAAGEGALLETGMGVGTLALKGLTKPFVSTIKANAPKLAEIAGKLKIKLTPADINNNPRLKKFEDLMSNTWIGADSMNEARSAQIQALRDFKLGISRKYGTLLSTEQVGLEAARTARELGKKKRSGISAIGTRLSERYGTKLSMEDVNRTVTESVIAKSQAENAVIKDIYAKRNAIIDMNREVPLKHTLLTSNAIQTAEQRAIIKGDPDLLSITSSFSKATPGGQTPYKRPTFGNVSDAITKINDKIVQENAIAMQSGLKGAAGQSTQKGRLLVQIKQGLQKDLDNYLRTQPKEARALNTLAKKKYTDFARVFKSDEIRALAEKDPVAIVTYLINTGRIKEFDMVKRAIGKTGIKPVQERFFQDIIGKAIPAEGELQAKAIDSVLQGYRPEILSRIFSKPQIEALKKLSGKIKGIPEDIKVLSEKDSMKMVKYVLNPARTQEFEGALAVLGKENITPLQKRFFQDIIDTAIPESGELNMSAIDTVMRTYKPEILARVMDPQAVRELKEISLLVNNLATKGIKAENQKHLGILQNTGAYGLSKIYASDTGRKLLMEGLKVKPNTEGAAKYSARAAQFMTMYGIPPNVEK